MFCVIYFTCVCVNKDSSKCQHGSAWQSHNYFIDEGIISSHLFIILIKKSSGFVFKVAVSIFVQINSLFKSQPMEPKIVAM
jgi:hypothetical protein